MPRKLILLSLIMAALAMSGPAEAQSSARLERATISIWPEYDRPSALVILRAELPSDTAFPTQVELKIPAGVGQPFAVAQRAGDDRLVNADYDFREGTEAWSTVVVTAETPVIWVEYYDNLEFAGEARTFEYTWPGTPLAGELLYEVQHPVGATDLILEPPATAEVVGADGLVYSRGPFQDGLEGSLPSFSLRYMKASSVLTVDAIGAAADSAPELPAQQDAARAPAEWLAYAVGGLGVVLLVGAGLLYWRNRASEGGGPSRPRRRSIARRQGGRYCHECGQVVSEGDRYCSNCGARLRQE